MPPLRGSVKLQFSSTNRWGGSAWVSMTIADLWTAEGSFMDSFLVFLWGVFGAGCCNWGVCAIVCDGLNASPASKSTDTDRRHFFMMDAIVSYASVRDGGMFPSEQPYGCSLPSVEGEVNYGTGSGFNENSRTPFA